MLHHQVEEGVVVVFYYICSLMTIYVNTFSQQPVPLAQPHKPLPSHAFQQVSLEGVSKRWEDALVQHVMEVQQGDFAHREAC